MDFTYYLSCSLNYARPLVCPWCTRSECHHGQECVYTRGQNNPITLIRTKYHNPNSRQSLLSLLLHLLLLFRFITLDYIGPTISAITTTAVGIATRQDTMSHNEDWTQSQTIAFALSANAQSIDSLDTHPHTHKQPQTHSLSIAIGPSLALYIIFRTRRRSSRQRRK